MPERINVGPPTISMGSAMYGSWTVDQPMLAPTEYVRGDIADTLQARIDELEKEKLLLAMFAADEPMFSNPILAAEVQSLRDKILSTHKGGEG